VSWGNFTFLEDPYFIEYKKTEKTLCIWRNF